MVRTPAQRARAASLLSAATGMGKWQSGYEVDRCYEHLDRTRAFQELAQVTDRKGIC